MPSNNKVHFRLLSIYTDVTGKTMPVNISSDRVFKVKLCYASW